MRILNFAILIFLLFTVPVGASYAARSEGIAVVVNESAVTISDVKDRMALIIASSGLPNTKDIQDKLMPQIIGSLVDEQVRLQEAARLDLSITQPEIDQGFATIAQQNNMDAAAFRNMIVKGGLNIKTMEDQIRAQLAWTKVIQAKLRPQIVVSESDIDSHLERLVNNTGQPEYQLSEIFLPVDALAEEDKTRDLAKKLVEDIREGKAEFAKMAQQFSQSPGAPEGGDLGWVGRGQLSENLDKALPTIGKGQVSDPIRTPTGFYILQVRDEQVVTEETLPSREEVMRLLGLQRLDRLQRRYLLDLKSAAIIENRLAAPE